MAEINTFNQSVLEAGTNNAKEILAALPLVDIHPSYHDEYMRNSQITTPNQLNYYEEKDDLILVKYVGTGVTLVSLIAENILSHPFQVLRRQCQINHTSRKFHLTPFTLLPTIYHLHQHQGATTLWKGLGSTLLVRGITLGVEDLISKTTPLPKEINWHSSCKDFLRHLLLKSISLVIVTPFYCASFVETVQSDVASEKPKLFDVFKEGFIRLLNWSGGYKGRMLPIWVLIVSTVTLGLGKYLFSLMIKGASFRMLQTRFRYRYESQGIKSKNLPPITTTSSSKTVIIQDFDLSSSLIAKISSDIAFYPCDTIIHRLYLQGTRTIVDNLDSGLAVLPILTNYVGAIDCYENCLVSEGKIGLYKGFGALILQYAVHIVVVQFSKFIFTEIAQLMRRRKIETIKPLSPDVVSHLSASHHSYLLP